MVFNVGAAAPNFPILSYTVGSNTYKFTGQEINNSHVHMKIENGYFKAWFYASGTLTPQLILKNADFCAIGRGANGGQAETSRDTQGRGIFYGGDGGKGGEVKNVLNKAIAIGSSVQITVGSTNRIVIGGETFTAGNGAGANGGIGGLWNDHNSNGRNGGNGAAGSYAFGDSSFDGIRYGGGGGGGKVPVGWYQGDGADGATAGARGHGGHGARNPGDGGPWPGDAGVNGFVVARIPLL